MVFIHLLIKDPYVTNHMQKIGFYFLPISVSNATDVDPLVSSIITLHVYVPSSPSIRYMKFRVLIKPVVPLMVTLLSFVIVSPPGPIQLIITELDSTPLTVLTIHWIIWGLPTIATCMGPDGDRVTFGSGTTPDIK